MGSNSWSQTCPYFGNVFPQQQHDAKVKAKPSEDMDVDSNENKQKLGSDFNNQSSQRNTPNPAAQAEDVSPRPRSRSPSRVATTQIDSTQVNHQESPTKVQSPAPKKQKSCGPTDPQSAIEEFGWRKCLSCCVNFYARQHTIYST